MDKIIYITLTVTALSWNISEAFTFTNTASNNYNNNGYSNKYLSHVIRDTQSISTRTSTCLSMSSPNRPRVGFPSTRKAPLKYLRIQPRRSRNNKQRIFELQTAVATMSKKLEDGSEVTIDLHAQLHFGENNYFQFYNDKAFGDKYDNIFYELIISDELLHNERDGTRRLLPITNRRDINMPHQYDSRPIDNPNPVAPPPSDESTASSYGLACQINVVDYTKPNWIHCDVTREEYSSILSSSSSSSPTSSSTQQPIWALSSTAMTPIQEYASALVRPFTPSVSQRSLSQFSSVRLFSNLFLPGANLASIFRILLWVLSPSPEVSILLLDWSSIVNPKPSGMISPIFVPSLESLLSGNLLNARRLIFAQLLVSGQTAGGQDLNLVRKRNSVALNILMNKVEKPYRRNQSMRTNNHAVLYGAMHCQDLQSRLEKMGYSLKKVEWRKSWSVNVPKFGVGENLMFGENRARQGGDNKINPMFMSDFASANTPSDIGVGLVIVPLYLLIGGLDWLGTAKDIACALDGSLWTEAVAVTVFYVLRHLALYMSLAKFVVEWDGEANLFGEDT